MTTAPFYIWEVEDPFSKLTIIFDPVHIEALEAKYAADPNGSYTFSRHNGSYTVSFAKMMQTSPSAVQRKVKRTLRHKPIWFFSSDYDGWQECTRRNSDSDTYEKLYQQSLQNPSVPITIQSYSLDFANLLQTNTDYGTVRDLYRLPAIKTNSTNNNEEEDPVKLYRSFVPVAKSAPFTKIDQLIYDQIMKLPTYTGQYDPIVIPTIPLSSFPNKNNYFETAAYVTEEHYKAWRLAHHNGTTNIFDISQFVGSKFASSCQRGDKKSKKDKKHSKKDKRDSKKDKKSSSKHSSSQQQQQQRFQFISGAPVGTTITSSSQSPFNHFAPSVTFQSSGAAFSQFLGDGDSTDETDDLLPSPLSPTTTTTSTTTTTTNTQTDPMEDELSPLPSQSPIPLLTDPDDPILTQHDSHFACPICQLEFVDPGSDSSEYFVPSDYFTSPTPKQAPLNAFLHLPCKHLVHAQCLKSHFNETTGSSAGGCPTCKATLLDVPGPQPGGKLTIRFSATRYCSGFNSTRSQGLVELNFELDGGIQDSRHYHPNTPYHGDHRVHYMPQTPYVMEILLPLYIKAWLRYHLFTIGRSYTRNQDDVITYSSIHMKSSPSGGTANHGYPDPDFYKNTTQELSNVGITCDEDDLAIIDENRK